MLHLRVRINAWEMKINRHVIFLLLYLLILLATFIISL